MQIKKMFLTAVVVVMMLSACGRTNFITYTVKKR